MSLHRSSATSSPSTGNTITVLHSFESRTAKGHNVVVQPGETYTLLNGENEDWWYVTREKHGIQVGRDYQGNYGVQDGFYLPRTFIRSATSTFRPSSMTLPADLRGHPPPLDNMQYRHSVNDKARVPMTPPTAAPRRTPPGFWLADNPNRISRSIPGDLDVTESADGTDVDNDRVPLDEHRTSKVHIRTPVKVEPVTITEAIIDMIGTDSSSTSSPATPSTMRSKRLSDPHSDNEDDASSTQEESDDGHDGSPDSAIDRPTAADDQRYENVNVLNSLNRRAPQPGAEQMPVEALDGDWLKYIDDVTQRAFFFHTPTRFASWKPPRGIIGPRQVSEMMNGSASDSSTDSVVPDDDKTALTIDTGKPQPPSPSVKPKLRRSSTQNSTETDTHESRVVVNPNPTATANARARFESVNGKTNNMSTSVDSGVVTQVTPQVAHSGGSLSVRNRSFAVKERAREYDAFSCSQQLAHVASSNSNLSSKPIQSLVNRTDIPRGAIAQAALHAAQSAQQTATKRGILDIYRVTEVGGKKIKKQWSTVYVYLTGAHIIFYKDEKSSEKLGQHYATPLSVLDLRGAKLHWIEGDKKHKHIFQLELAETTTYAFSEADTQEINSWYHAIRLVIARLPIPDFYPTPSSAGSNGSAAEVAPPSASSVRRSILMPQTKTAPKLVASPSLDTSSSAHFSAISTSTVPTTTRKNQRLSFTHRSTNGGEGSPMPSTSDQQPAVALESKASILDRLRRFFRNRPTLESLKDKGIYQPEPVFGSSLKEIGVREKSTIPKFLRICTAVIEEKGLEADGLYRISGNLSQVQKIRCQVDQDKYQLLKSETDIHVITGALKLFFRELQTPAFPHEMSKAFLDAIRIQKPRQRAKVMTELISRMPDVHHDTLQHLFLHLLKVASYSSSNRMQVHNLAIVFGPTLFSSGECNKPIYADKKKGKTKTAKPAGGQSNSHLAFNMIMHGQIVEYLLRDFETFFPRAVADSAPNSPRRRSSGSNHNN